MFSGLSKNLTGIERHTQAAYVFRLAKNLTGIEMHTRAVYALRMQRFRGAKFSTLIFVLTGV